MKVIVLYGMPAVGKLTIAKKLEKIVDYKIFHNHLSYDLINSFLSKESKNFWEHVRRLRFDSIKIAKKEAVNLILTTCYMGKESDLFIKKLISFCNKEKINLKFIHLFCSEKENLKRVTGKSRKKFGKLKDPKQLKRDFAKYGQNVKISYVKSVSLDVTKLNPENSAKKIRDLI